MNNKVNNWGIELSNFKIKFEHIKGKKNIMADALSRLKHLDLYDSQDPEPVGQEFGHIILENLKQRIVTLLKSYNTNQLMTYAYS